MKVYFRDNFFSAGKTEIWGENQEARGEVDLRSAFGSALDVYDTTGALAYSGKFPVFSNRWQVFNANGEEVGQLRYRLAFFQKRYEYDAYDRGCFEITSPAFSSEYDICGEAGTAVARFQKVSGWFASEAYCLDNSSSVLDSYELVAVIMGVNAIKKRHRSAAANA